MKYDKQGIKSTGLNLVYEADNKGNITVEYGSQDRDSPYAHGIYSISQLRLCPWIRWISSQNLGSMADDCPESRIFSWGYDTQVTKRWRPAAKHSIWTHATDLLNFLAGYRENDRTSGRKLVFVAHSLGGIIVKHVSVILLSMSHKLLLVSL